MIKKIKSISKAVLDILWVYPETRDNDRLLMFKVWARQNPNLRDEFYHLRIFAQDFIHGYYADPESIRRTRQKLQEKYPGLRGRVYYERHKAELDVREQINENFV